MFQFKIMKRKFQQWW